MYFRAWFSESAFSPKWVYSSSVVGTQNGSISTTYDKKGKKKNGQKYKLEQQYHLLCATVQFQLTENNTTG